MTEMKWFVPNDGSLSSKRGPTDLFSIDIISKILLRRFVEARGGNSNGIVILRQGC